MQKHNHTAALAKLTASMLIFGTIGLFRRWIDLPSGALAVSRAVLGTAFLGGFLLLRRSKKGQRLEGRKTLLLCLAGALMGFNWIALFEAYRFTSVATATLCYYMQPTILILLSPLVFGERLDGKRLLCAAVSLGGMVLLTGANASGGGEGRGIALGLGAAALYAAVIVVNKKAGEGDPIERTMVQLFAAAVTLLPYVILTEDVQHIALTGATAGIVLVVGLVHTGLAYVLYFAGMDDLSAQTIALLSYVDPVSAVILSALLLREPLSLSGWAGAALIVGAALYGELSSTEKE